MLNQKTWFLKRRSLLYIGSSEMQSSVSKFKGSIFAILFGLIIACFVIIGSGQNAITYFQLLLTYAFTSWPANNWDNTLVWWAVYIVAGLALVVSFRSGMFNIGVAGQMLAAGAVVITIGVRYDLSQPVAIIFALGAGILTAISVALLTALLKVFFNVHEVVTSILLNWTIWYLVKWLFKRSSDLYDSSHGTTATIHEHMSMSIGGYNCILPLLIAGILVITIWFLLKKTTLGYKVRTVGLNPFAADYGGINRKRYCVTSFVISGALAGVMAVIYYVAKNPSISFLTDDLPTIGFDSIAVALVGQINAFGVVGAAFLWGLIKSGGSIGTVLTLPTATGDIIFGVIIYSAACAVLLARLEPLKFIIRYCNIVFSKDKRKTVNGYIGKMYQLFVNTFKIKKEYNLQIKAMKVKINQENQFAIETLKKENYQILVKQQKNKTEIENQIQQLKQQYASEINKLSKVSFKLEIANLTTKYNVENEKLVKAKQQALLTIKKTKQQLRKNILQQKNIVNQDLQDLINAKNDKVGISWAQMQQEKKALNYYMHKQYNAIWKKGKIGNWNNIQNQKKAIYGESLNSYISEKITYENVVYNYKLELIRELTLLKQQKNVLKKSRTKDLVQAYKWQLNLDKKQLQKTIAPLLKDKTSQSKLEIKNLNNQFNAKVQADRKTLHDTIHILKHKKISPINSSITTLNQQFTKKLAFEKDVFQQKFSALLEQETKTIMQIKTQKLGGDN
ncbi:ABC transporter permease subunit [Spiroplasma endosymbiont of Nebria brevicollis]|uniref:ABC transporter permease subunit n=1 Tax=Spiroplasma endosymbiont of Nebria brevicollis TaxID=3066284 RepID=UPI00313BD80E